jgi:Na+-transporting NADH:ubiquinone oxidoreductase subunit B
MFSSWKKKLSPLFVAIDNFLWETPTLAKNPPFVRDAINLKRWMIIVVIAILPSTIVAIYNTGMQSIIFSNPHLQTKYLLASTSIYDYLLFSLKNYLFIKVIIKGLLLTLPIILVSYIVGGFWEVLFACVRKKPISEGFLVTGLLFPLTLPPTIPLWMVAVGISVATILAKEIFGGTGMNIFNPALIGRCFIYFAFPAYMTGNVFVQANNDVQIDGITTQTILSVYNIPSEIKTKHINAIAIANGYVKEGHLIKSNLDLDEDLYNRAEEFTKLKYGKNLYSNSNLFWGNKQGSIGEVSIFAILLGALLLLVTNIGSWRIMASFSIGIFLTSFAFEYFSKLYINSPAIFDFPAYKQFLLGGLLFGIVFMATDPVSSPSMNLSKWLFGFLGGFLVIIIRNLNPAYPEGVMLAIIFINMCAPLLDDFAIKIFRRKKRYVS